MQQMKLSETLEGVLSWLTENAHTLEARARPADEDGSLAAKIEELTARLNDHCLFRPVVIFVVTFTARESRSDQPRGEAHQA